MKEKQGRSLYQCFNAKVKGEKVSCAKEHDIGLNRYRALSRGAPLIITQCQTCLDYDEMGEPVEKADRGWVKLKNR